MLYRKMSCKRLGMHKSLDVPAIGAWETITKPVSVGWVSGCFMLMRNLNSISMGKLGLRF